MFRRGLISPALSFSLIYDSKEMLTWLCLIKGIDGVPKIKDGYNPATWMLEVTSAAQEVVLGVNFTDIYRSSDLYR